MSVISADDAVNASVMAAQAMTDYAVIWSPMVEDISTIMGNGSGGPFALGEGASHWQDAAAKLESAQQRLAMLTEAVSREQWGGDDRDAFDKEMSQLEAQLGDSHNYAMAVGITLEALTFPIAAWPVEALVIGAIEFANASAFYAAAASVVGDFGPAEAIFAEGEAVTGTCLAVMNASMVIMIALMAAATAAIAISDIADIDAQSHNADTGIAAEFGKATVDSAGDVIMNVAVDRLNHRMGKEEPSEPGRHAAPEGETDSTESHAPRHLDPPKWDETYKERRGDWLKEKAREKAGDVGSSPLSHVINAGASAADPDWNDPDAPSPDDEKWGHG